MSVVSSEANIEHFPQLVSNLCMCITLYILRISWVHIIFIPPSLLSNFSTDPPFLLKFIPSLTNIVKNMHTHTHPLSHLMFLHAYVFRADHLALEAHHGDFSLKKTVSLSAVINCFFSPPFSYFLLLWAMDRIAKQETREWFRRQAQYWNKLISCEFRNPMITAEGNFPKDWLPSGSVSPLKGFITTTPHSKTIFLTYIVLKKKH